MLSRCYYHFFSLTIMFIKFSNFHKRMVEFKRYCEIHPLLSRALLNIVLEAGNTSGDVVLASSRLHRLRGEYTAAERDLGLLIGSADPLVQAARLDNLGRIYFDTQRFKEADDAYSEGLLRTTEPNNGRFEEAKRRRASLINNLGYNILTRADRKADVNEASRWFDSSLSMYQELDDLEGIAYVLIHQVELERKRGNLFKSEDLLSDAIEREQEIRNFAGLALAHQQSAKNILVQHQLGMAHHLFKVAYHQALKVPACRRIRADIAADLSRVSRALSHKEDFTRIARTLYSKMDLPKSFVDRQLSA